MAKDTSNINNSLEHSIHTLPSTTRDWHRKVWVLAGPVILSNLSVPLVGAIDTAVVGHLPDAIYMGAVALGAIVFNFLYWGFGFLRMGTSGFVAQAYGAGDASEIRSTLARGLLIAVVLGILVIAMQILYHLLVLLFIFCILLCLFETFFEGSVNQSSFVIS